MQKYLRAEGNTTWLPAATLEQTWHSPPVCAVAPHSPARYATRRRCRACGWLYVSRNQQRRTYVKSNATKLVLPSEAPPQKRQKWKAGRLRVFFFHFAFKLFLLLLLLLRFVARATTTCTATTMTTATIQPTKNAWRVRIALDSHP